MSRKIDFAESVQLALRQLRVLSKQTEVLEKAYFDNEFGSGGSNEIVDGDIQTVEITAADLANGINVLTHFNNFLNNRAVTAGDWKSKINKITRTFKN